MQIEKTTSEQHPTEEGTFTVHQQSLSSASEDTENGDEPLSIVPDFDPVASGAWWCFRFALPTASSDDVRKYVKWCVCWEELSYVVVCVLGGIALALGHHFSYQSLDGSFAGSASRQQWALTFDTSFS
jgi:hypothetical protein